MLLGKPALKYEERAAAAKVEEEEDEIATQPRGRCFIVSYVLGTKSSLNRLLISLLLSCCSTFEHVKVENIPFRSQKTRKYSYLSLKFMESLLL